MHTYLLEIDSEYKLDDFYDRMGEKVITEYLKITRIGIVKEVSE